MTYVRPYGGFWQSFTVEDCMGCAECGAPIMGAVVVKNEEATMSWWHKESGSSQCSES